MIQQSNEINELGLMLKNGDTESFEKIYNKSIQWVRSDVYKHIKDDDVDDCVQDIYVKLYNNIGQYNPEKGKFSTWFNTLVTNETINFARRYHTQMAENMEYIDDDENFDELVDLSATPEQYVENEEVKHIIAKLLGEISESQKSCISMVFIDDMSYKDTAKALGVSEGTVKSRVFNGLKKIRSSIEAMKKKGIAIFGVAPVPTFLYMLKNCNFTADAKTVEAGWAAINMGVSNSGNAPSVYASATISESASTSLVVTKEATAFGLKKKIIMSIASVAVAGGIIGGIFALNKMRNNNEIYNKEYSKEESNIIDSDNQIVVPSDKTNEVDDENEFKQYLSFLDKNYTNFVFRKEFVNYSFHPENDCIYFIDVTGDGVKEFVTVQLINAAENLRIYKMIDGKLTLVNDELLSIGDAAGHNTTYYIDDKGTFIYCLDWITEDYGGTIEYFVKEYDAEKHSFMNRRILLKDEKIEPVNGIKSSTITYFDENDNEITKDAYEKMTDSLLSTAKIIVQSNVNDGDEDHYISEGKFTLEEAIYYLIKEAGDDLKNYKNLETYLSLDHNIIKAIYATTRDPLPSSGNGFKSKNVYTMPVEGKTAVIVLNKFDAQINEWVYEEVDDGNGNMYPERVEKPFTKTISAVYCFVPGYDAESFVFGENITFENNLIHIQGLPKSFPGHWCNVDNDYYIIENGEFKKVYHYMIDYDEANDLVSKELYASDDGATMAIEFSGTGIELSVVEKEIEALKDNTVNVEEIDYSKYLILD